MKIEQALKVLASRVTLLQSSPNRQDRIEAARIGQLIGAHARGRVGDCLLISAAR